MNHKITMTADTQEEFELITLTNGDSADTIYSLRPTVRFDGAYDDEFDYDSDDDDEFEEKMKMTWKRMRNSRTRKISMKISTKMRT